MAESSARCNYLHLDENPSRGPAVVVKNQKQIGRYLWRVRADRPRQNTMAATTSDHVVRALTPVLRQVKHCSDPVFLCLEGVCMNDET